MQKNLRAVIIYHTQSEQKNTELIALAIKLGLMDKMETELIQTSEAINKFDIINNAHAIIFGSPTYFGIVSSSIKAFMELTGQMWLKQTWKDKVAAGFTHSSTPSGDKLSTLQGIEIFLSST